MRWQLAAVVAFLAWSTLGQAAGNFAGRWEGVLEIPGQEAALVIDLDQSNGTNWSGSIIIPGLGVKGAELTKISVKASDIRFEINGALSGPRVEAPTLKAHLTNSGTQLTGEFLQGGNKAPFTLRKIGPAEVELPHKSTAVTAGLEGEWKGDYQMNGYARHVTLTLANHSSSGATATLVVVGKKTTNAPVDRVIDDDGFLTIESQALAITYEGRWNKDAGEIRGIFTLGPFEMPLILRRSAKAS